MLKTLSKNVYQFIMLALHFTTIRKYKVPQRIMDIVLISMENSFKAVSEVKG